MNSHNRRTRLAGAGAALTGLALVAAVATSTPTSARFDRGRPLSADLSGGAEVPGPGDPDGTGRIDMRVNATGQQICYEITVENITPATDAFIHRAPAGEVGPAVVQLVPPGPGGRVAICVFVETEVGRDIIKHPGDYYVSVQNAGFLDGAVRGQLGR
jgi:hypothetical protein